MQLRTLRATGLLIAAAVIGIAALGSACGGDDDEGGASEAEVRAIEKTVRDLAAAYEAKDFDAYSAVHTDAGLRADLDAHEAETTEELKESFDEQVADDTLVIDSIDAVEVDGDKATAIVGAYQEAREEPSAVSILIAVNAGFVKDGDGWKVDSVAFGSPAVPEDATTVHVDANEFAFAFAAEDVTSGNVAFEIANVGKQPHHVFIVKIPADLDIEAALQSDEDPEGAVELGGTAPWDPGKTTNIVFTGPLEAGRYVMLCFMPDTDDPEMTPHAFKGMYKDFTVN